VRLVEIVRVEAPVVEIEEGVKLELAFFGNPLRLSVTVPEKVPTDPTVTE
jgi:hypothetical protein